MGGTVRIEGGNLVFELFGVDEILSIKRSLSVPLGYVVSVSTETVPWKSFQHLRVGSTFFPRVIKDGRFLTSDGLMFFEMHDPDKCVTVSLNHGVYKKIVFEVDDKEAAAKMIRDAVKARQGSSGRMPKR